MGDGDERAAAFRRAARQEGDDFTSFGGSTDKRAAEYVDAADRALSVESSAWMARYGTMPSAPSNRFTVTAFDDYIQSTSSGSVTVYSNPVLSGVLGMFDQIAIQVVADHVVASGSLPTVLLTVQIQHSADGRRFLDKSASPEVSLPALDPQGETAMKPGYDDGSAPNLGYIRLELVLTNSAGAAVSARVKVYVTCNDYREAAFTNLMHHRQRQWDKAFDPILEAQLLATIGRTPNPGGSSHNC